LTQEESETLVSYLLDIDDLPDSAKNRILERSEGEIPSFWKRSCGA
jgi:hypothetical protein